MDGLGMEAGSNRGEFHPEARVKVSDGEYG